MELPPWHEEKRDPVVLDNILKKDAPPIHEKWSEEYRDLVKQCLTRDEVARPTVTQIMEHPFLNGAEGHKSEFTETIVKYLAEA